MEWKGKGREGKGRRTKAKEEERAFEDEGGLLDEGEGERGREGSYITEQLRSNLPPMTALRTTVPEESSRSNMVPVPIILGSIVRLLSPGLPDRLMSTFTISSFGSTQFGGNWKVLASPSLLVILMSQPPMSMGV